MIKVGILGASSPVAGEIIRILVNHPDVEIAVLYEPSLSGKPATSCHYGLIGEFETTFSESIPLPRLDAVIICTPSEAAGNIVASPSAYPDLRVIDLTGSYDTDPDNGLILGLSEVNRKPLVRGAKRAYIPTTTAALAMIALYPAAASLLLNDDIEIFVSGRYNAPTEKDAAQTVSFLKSVQNSFDSNISFVTGNDREPGHSGHGVRLRCVISSVMPADEIARLFENIYDDHNFTFLTNAPADLRQVEGTQKCLVNVSKQTADKAVIDIIGDSAMRGAAGDAVHILNLLFGLHERTGLALKALNCQQPCL